MRRMRGRLLFLGLCLILLPSVTWAETVATPTFSPDAGSYAGAQNVVVKCATDGAVVRYTTNGETPTETSPTIAWGASVLVDHTMVLKAKAWKPNWTASAVKEAQYTIGAQTVATPTFTPDGGSYAGPQNVIVKCATDGAVIHYTTNGETPTETSPTIAWGGTIAVNHSVVLKAKAWREGWTPSAIKAAEYTITDAIVATPTFDPPGGTYSAPINVIIRCATEGAIIRYTTNGLDPTEQSPTVANGGTVPVSASLVLKAKAWKLGLTASAVARAEYHITIPTVATPTFDPDGGTYAEARNVIIRCATELAVIRYTTNGETPTETSAEVANGGTVLVDKAMVLKAKAWRTGWTPSEVKAAEYHIAPAQVATPTFDPAGGTYSEAKNVIIRCATEGAIIRYTTNGEEPTESSTQIVSGGSVLVDKSLVLKAKAWKLGMTASLVKAAEYHIVSGVVTTPTFEPDGGHYTTTVAVVVRCATDGAVIRFTTNGETPTETSHEIANGGSITVDRSMILKAKAWKLGLTASAVKRAEYVVTTETPGEVTADLAAGWNMVSVPVAPAGGTWPDWTSALGGITPVAVYAWDGSAYVEAPDPIPGQGYWVKMAGGSTAGMAGVTVGSSTAIDLHGSDTGEWNLVGNPFAAALVWNTDQIRVKADGLTKTLSDAAAAGWMRDYGWSWDSAAGAYKLVCDGRSSVPSSIGSLNPGASLWLRAFRDCLLLLGTDTPPPPPGQ